MEMRLASCTLRSWRRTDAASLVQHANNRNVWLNLRDLFPHPYTNTDAMEWLALVTGRETPLRLAIEVDGAAVGGIGLNPQGDVYRMSAELGYWLGEPYWGRGIMTAAVGACTDYAFETLGLTRLFATVFAWNPASMRVLEKAGYEREGYLRQSVLKDGRVIDSVLYARLASADAADQAIPHRT